MAIEIGNAEFAFGEELHHKVVLHVDAFLLVPFEEHLDAGVDEDAAEDEEYPMEFLDEGGGGEDEEEPEHDGTQDAVEEHAVVVFFLHAEGHQDHNHHEDVVDGEGLLHRVAGDVFEGEVFLVGFQVLLKRGVGADGQVLVVFLADFHKRLVVVHIVDEVAFAADEDKEGQGQGYPDAGPHCRFLEGHLLVLLMENTEVHGEEEDNECQEAQEENGLTHSRKF